MYFATADCTGPAYGVNYLPEGPNINAAANFGVVAWSSSGQLAA